MVRKAEYLTAKAIIQTNEPLLEILKLKFVPIFRDMDDESLLKYGLLKAGHVIPTMLERAIGNVFDILLREGVVSNIYYLSFSNKIHHMDCPGIIALY